MIKVAILTLSDTRKKDEDLSGKIIRDMLNKDIFGITEYDVIRDEKKKIKRKLLYYADNLKVDLVLTTGGTGLGPRDVTPEATNEIIEKEVPGRPELMRMEGFKKTNRAMLSRAVAGIRKGTLIVNLPGSPKGAKDSLSRILEILPHAVLMLKGGGH